MLKKILLFSLFISISSHSFSQMKRWILGSPCFDLFGSPITPVVGQLKFYEADFSAGTPVFSSRTLGTSITSIVSGGTNEPINNALDAAGNVSFYVFVNCPSPYTSTTMDVTYFVAYDPVTGKDEVFASIPGIGGGASSVKGIEVIKREGFVNQFYVIYKTACINSQPNDYIKYVIVDMATKTITSPVTISYLGHNEGMAISPLDCATNSRWLFFAKYVGGNMDVYRSSISSGSISAPVFVTTILIPGNASAGQGDIEISPQGDKIAFDNLATVNVNQDVIIMDLDLSTGGLTSQRWINNPSNYIYSCEFSPDGQRIYLARSGTGAIANELYNVAVTSINYTILPSDLVSVSLSQGLINLEIGYDQNLYFNHGSYNTDLIYISNPNATAATNIVSQTPVNSFGIGSAVGVAFPDQIDGLDINSNLNPIITSSALSICAGESVTLTGSAAAANQWSGGATDTAAVITISPLSTTTYYLQVSNGVCVGFDTITITVNSLPVASIVGDTSICSGQSATLTASGATSYQWSGGSSATSSSITVNPIVTTVYTVTPYNGGCFGTPVSDTVNVVTTNAQFTHVSSACSEDVLFLNSSPNANYYWNFGDGVSSSLANPTHTFPIGIYIVEFITNPNSVCSDTAYETITILEVVFQPLVIPNVFTPNGDGLNDSFIILGVDFCHQYTLDIFNRWGQIVFKTESPDFVFWDGKNGEKDEIIDGVYFYLLSPKDNYNDEILKGCITVIR